MAFNNPTGNPTTGGGIIGVGSGASANSLYIASSSNVGIGTTVPDQKLDVAGNLAVQGAVFTQQGQLYGGAYISAGLVFVSATTANITGMAIAIGVAQPKYQSSQAEASATNAHLICRALGFARAASWTTKPSNWHTARWDGSTWYNTWAPSGELQVFDVLTCQTYSCMTYSSCPD